MHRFDIADIILYKYKYIFQWRYSALKNRLTSIILILAMLLLMLPQAGMAEVDNDAIYGNYEEEAAAVPAYNPIVPEATSAASVEYPSLKTGDSDEDFDRTYITFLQNRLIELGYISGSADGNYGKKTAKAVRSFQKNNGLPTTGVADSATQTLLYQDESTLVRSTENTATYSTDTTRIQSLLAQWGFLASGVDGNFGKNTSNAIKRFKKYMRSVDKTYGVTPSPAPTSTPMASAFGDMPVAEDEVVSLSTKAMANSDIIDAAMLDYIEGRKKFPVYRKTVKKGSKGDEVWRVQRRLRYLGYLYKPDGLYGALTQYALKYFQYRNGLKQTGIADKATQKKLFSANPKKSKEFVFPYKYVVDVSEQRVYALKWNGKGYNKVAKKFKCSTGKADSPTPYGTFHAAGITGAEWYYFRAYNCYARWATRIVGGILFHSITYNSRKKQVGKESQLGHRAASHGCIRLSVNDAKWIYFHCPSGTTVVVRR